MKIKTKKLKDKSKHCGFKFENGYLKTEKDRTKYFKKYCSKCKHMSEICMFGEEIK